jgi:hypothetical protein
LVISLNLHGRHLSESQRAMVAAKLANMRQGERTDLEPSANWQKVSIRRAAEILNVSERSVARWWRGLQMCPEAASGKAKTPQHLKPQICGLRE